MNYYSNVSLIGSSTKNDRCQDVTNINYKTLDTSSRVQLNLLSSFFKTHHKTNFYFHALLQ